MQKGNSDLLPPELAVELASLEDMPDDTIDTSEMPEVRDWSGAQRGRFYKPRKLQKTLRIDADVLAWFEAQGPGHLTRMNRALRATMLSEIRRKKKGGAASRLGRGKTTG
jgi:uncharacterized protein (DUF4415 family)